MKPEIVTICMTCRRRVRGDAGVVHIPYKEIYRVEREKKSWKEGVAAKNFAQFGDLGARFQILDSGDLNDMPDDAAWLVHCDECNPHKHEDGSMCGGCYWMNVGTFSTWAELVEHTCHLSEKNWFDDTDWMGFIRGVKYSNKSGLVDAARAMGSGQ